MGTVRLTDKLVDQIQDLARKSTTEAVALLSAKVLEKQDTVMQAIYEQLMPAGLRNAWETLPDEYRHYDTVPTLYIRLDKEEPRAFFFKNVTHKIRLPEPLERPPELAKFFNQYTCRQMKNNTLADFKVALPGAYELISEPLDHMHALLASQDVLREEIDAACKANVTLNRLLKAVPGFEKYIPPAAMTALRKPRGMISSADNQWVPGQLKSAMLTVNITTT